MKTIRRAVVIALAIVTTALSASAQGGHYIGIRGGAGASKVRFYPRKESKLLLPNMTYGVAYKYLGGDRFFGGVELDVNYVEKGYKYLVKSDSDSSLQRKLTAIELPFMWQPHVWFAQNRARFFLNAGPYLSYMLKTSDERLVSKKDGEQAVYSYDFNSLRDNRLEYGLSAGAGFGATIAGRLEVLFEFRYVVGFSDILKNPNKYPGSITQESPIDQMNVTLGIHYLFIRQSGRSTIAKEPRVSKKERRQRRQ
ncbi:MAG: PorT family protein [Rikenellaceae bacterium]|nr:PorT family protein [Rikenellaceae bacterium]